MKVVILAAGRGQRFQRRGVTTPKSLLSFRGRPIIEHNLLAFLDAGVQVVVVCSPTVAHYLSSLHLPSLTLVPCPVIQSGPVTSALLAGAYVDLNEQVLILDSDQVYSQTVVPYMLSNMTTRSRLVVCDAGPSPNWCSVHEAADGSIALHERGGGTTTVVSGGYGFSSWGVFQSSAYYLLGKLDSSTEPKMSATIFPQDTELVRLERNEWISFGTPEEFEENTKLWGDA